MECTQARWNATAFLSGFGHVVISWVWLDMARAALERRSIDDALFPEGKLRACRYFIESELPRACQWLAQADVMSDTAATMAEGAF
jgi:butyryl-CoA dehydrogenase